MVDAAVRSAKGALKGPWGRMALQARVDLLRKVADGIENASTTSCRRKSPIRANRCRSRAISTFRAARRTSASSHIVRTYGTEAYHLDTPDGKGAVNYAVRKPSACRRDRTLEPAASAPHLEARTGARLRQYHRRETFGRNALDRDPARRGHARGWRAAGVYNVVHGFGPDSAASSSHAPGSKRITFTGETATARRS